MSYRTPALIRIVTCVVSIGCASTALAQEQTLESRLPAKTMFYISWHGSRATANSRATNSVLRLWDDPQFATARAAMVAEMFSSVPKEKVILSQAEVSNLLENPILFGAIPRPKTAAVEPAGTGKGAPPSMDVFLIYERTGKEEILAKLLALEKSGTTPPTVAKETFRETEIESVTETKSTYHRTASGRYLIVSQRREIVEDLIGRLATASAPQDSLLNTSLHRAAFAQVKEGDAASFFFNIQDPLREAVDTVSNAKSAGSLMRALHADKLESLSGTLTFNGPTTRMRVSLLGDLSAGGLTDMIGAGAPNFLTPAAAPATAMGFNSMRLDLTALYRAIREAAAAMAPPGQPNPADSVESAVSKQVGMTVPEIMRVLSGEFATVELEPSLDFSDRLFLLGIDKPDDVLHLVRVMMTDSIQNEESSGAVTYLAILSPLTPKKTGTAAPTRRFLYVAVGPHLLVVAPRKAMARETMARFESADHAGSLLADPRFLAARERLPKNLSGLSYSDLSKMDWAKLRKAVEDASERGAAQAAADPASLSENQKTAKRIGEIWKLIPFEQISRYIHSSYGGWWKDQRGIYLDSYTE